MQEKIMSRDIFCALSNCFAITVSVIIYNQTCCFCLISTKLSFWLNTDEHRYNIFVFSFINIFQIDFFGDFDYHYKNNCGISLYVYHFIYQI